VGHVTLGADANEIIRLGAFANDIITLHTRISWVADLVTPRYPLRQCHLPCYPPLSSAFILDTHPMLLLPADLSSNSSPRPLRRISVEGRRMTRLKRKPLSTPSAPVVLLEAKWWKPHQSATHNTFYCRSLLTGPAHPSKTEARIVEVDRGLRIRVGNRAKISLYDRSIP